MKNALVGLSLILGTNATDAATFTVCASGCTHTTISAAYSAAACGDSIQVNVNGGIDETPSLSKHCTNASPLTIVAGAGYSPRIDPTATGWIDAVYMDGSYNVWDGIGVYDVYHGNGITIVGDHNTVRNSLIDRISYNDWPTAQNASGIRIIGSYNLIRNNTVLDTDHEAITVDGTATTASYNQVLNNTIKNRYGHGVTMLGSGAQYNLVDGNDISDCGSLCVGAGCASKNALQLSGARNNSIRRNVVHDIYNRAVEESSYSGVTSATVNNWFYNNTFYNITTRSSDTTTVYFAVLSVSNSAGYTTTNSTFRNNIIDKACQRNNTDFNRQTCFTHYYAIGTGAGTSQSAIAANDWNGNTLINNIIRPYYSGAYHPELANAIYYLVSGYNNGWTVTGVNGIGSMAGNTSADPLLASTNTSQSNWWQLRAGSPAIDGGVVVNDPNAASGGWAQLTYNGSAPDIGAFESPGTGTQLPPPTNLRIVQ